MPEQKEQNSNLLTLTANVAAAHFGNNQVAAEEIPGVIQRIYRALAGLGGEIAAIGDKPQPAVPVKKSVTPDHIVCLEDGKKLKMLKRHLQTSYGLSPDAYRNKWGLSRDYPMTAPNYAATRSTLAKSIGLGRKPAAAQPVVAKGPARRGRGAKE